MYINTKREFYNGDKGEARGEPNQDEGSSEEGKVLPNLSSFIDPGGTRTLLV